jgi:hypothetical protein
LNIVAHICLAAVGVGGGLLAACSSSLHPDGDTAFRVGINGLAVAVICGGALFASALRLIRPYRLILRPNELLVERSFRQSSRIRWDQVEAFFVRGSSVGVRFAKSLGLSSLAMGSNGPFGSDEVLPVGEFNQSAEQITALLNSYRTRAAPLRVTG